MLACMKLQGIYMLENSFKILPLSSEIISALDAVNYQKMTPIQEQSLPMILEGRDVLAQAKTGSGKTAAFGLGVLSKIDIHKQKPQALVLCPTRELAEQVTKEIRKLASFIPNLTIRSLCGGSAIQHQIKSLENTVHIAVGTPGRVLKLLKIKALKTKNIQTLVLDEADRMLDMGFQEDILKIISKLPQEKQTLLFSATYPEEILEMSKSLQKSALKIQVDTEVAEDKIQEYFYVVDEDKNKAEALIKVLSHYQPESAIVFCKTKQMTKDLAHYLRKQKISALALHGDLEQKERVKILVQFTNKSCRILVATDVAARGLDIADIESVINFDLPTDSESYVHRVGRTARAGKEGTAISLFQGEAETTLLNKINKELKLKYQPLKIKSMARRNAYYNLKSKMRTLFVSGGRKDKVRPGDILGALVHHAKIEPNSIGKIDVMDVLSFVAVEFKYAEKAKDKMQTGKIKGKKFKVGFV